MQFGYTVAKQRGGIMGNICGVSSDGEHFEDYAFKEDAKLCDIVRDMGFSGTICSLMNGSIVSLGEDAQPGAKVRFLSPDQNEQASRVFLRGATFLLYCAARALYPERQLRVEYALAGGVYCELGEITKADIKALEGKISEYIARDGDFMLEMMSVEAARQIMQSEGLCDKVELLKYRPFDFYRLYAFDGRRNYFHGIMPKSSGYLKGMRLYAYADGIMLKYPSPHIESRTPIINQPKYAAVFDQAEKWARVLSASNVSDINDMFREGDIEDFISVNEAMHEKTIVDIAQSIVDQKEVRIVLIAGPSSSGKTTFAHRLSVHLRVLGKKCYPISVDDYYKGRCDVPLDAHGKPDFECVEALDTEKLGTDLRLLLKGGTAQMPRFDFIAGGRKTQGVPLRIGEGDILVIEGLHGLNDALTQGVPKNVKFKIFIAPLTTLNIDDHSVVMPEDLRLLRRLVRDKRTRGYSFAQTFSIWDSVRRGEFKYILPYQESADVMFNSTLIYEPLILKKYCYGELKRFTPDMPNYPEALSLLKFLNYFLSMDKESAIPVQSLLREFIGKP
jgi:uridine kinase